MPFTAPTLTNSAGWFTYWGLTHLTTDCPSATNLAVANAALGGVHLFNVLLSVALIISSCLRDQRAVAVFVLMLILGFVAVLAMYAYNLYAAFSGGAGIMLQNGASSGCDRAFYMPSSITLLVASGVFVLAAVVVSVLACVAPRLLKGRWRGFKDLMWHLTNEAGAGGKGPNTTGAAGAASSAAGAAGTGGAGAASKRSDSDASPESVPLKTDHPDDDHSHGGDAAAGNRPADAVVAVPAAAKKTA